MRGFRRLCALAVVLLAGCVPVTTGQRGEQGPLPVQYDIRPIAEAYQADSAAPPPGANDFSCRPSRSHPRPVVLVHGFLATQSYWQTLSPLLKNNGYCVFTLTYGSPAGQTLIGGVAPLSESSQELATFVHRVLAATGARKVDIVGHSEGSELPQYYMKFEGGAAKVHEFVALAGWFDPSTPLDVTKLVGVLEQLPFGLGDGLRGWLDSQCGPCGAFVDDPTIVEALNVAGVVPAGVHYTTIVTRYDELVQPTSAGEIHEPHATSVIVQNGCEQDQADHISVAFDPRALGFVLNALDPQHAVPPPCVRVAPAYGAY